MNKINISKKILYIAADLKNEYKTYLPDEARKVGAVLDMATFSQIVIFYESDSIVMEVNNKRLESYDLVFIGKVRGNQKTMACVVEYCLQKKIKLEDKFLLDNRYWRANKEHGYLKLQKNGIPITSSILVSRDGIEHVKNKIAYPCVAKLGGTSQGKGVFLCKTEADLLKVLDDHDDSFLVQKFIKNDGDLRVLIINHKVIGAIKRSAGEDDEFRNNVSLGGEAVKYDPDQKITDLALKSAKVMGYSLVGIDLIYNSEAKEWQVMEVNRNPGFKGFMKATGINVPELIVGFMLSLVKEK